MQVTEIITLPLDYTKPKILGFRLRRLGANFQISLDKRWEFREGRSSRDSTAVDKN